MTEAEVSAYIARRIRTHARKRKLSLVRLADFAGVSRSGIFAILAGERLPSICWLLKIANALDTTPGSLVP